MTLGDQQRVRQQLISVHIRHIPVIMLGNMFAAVLLVLSCWQDEQHAWLLAWLLLDGVLSMFAVGMGRRFEQSAPEKQKLANWRYCLLICWLLFGMLWGSSALMFMNTAEPFSFIVITILLLGVMVSPLYPLALLPPSFYLFSSAIIVPFAGKLLWQGVYVSVFMAAIGMLMFLLWSARYFYDMAYELISLRFVNEAYVSDLKHAIHEAERANMAKTRFLASASHDLRQPLQAMALYAETLGHRLKDKKNIEVMASLKASHASMRKIMDSLLDISKLDAGIVEVNIRPVDIRALVENLMQEFQVKAEKKGIQLRCRVEQAYVVSDAVLLESVLRNLMSNAVRHTVSGGVLIACRYRSRTLWLEVWDSGPGIPEEQRDNVFLEFYQLNNPEHDREKGLGLGLAIVKRLLDLMPMHQLSLASRPGQGTCFRLSMPLSDTVPHTIQETVVEPDLFGGMRVLVIEDDMDVRKAMLSLTHEWGCVAHGVGHVSAALQSVRDGFVPDVIVADYRLPQYGNGLQAVLKIRQLVQYKVPALIVSGELQADILKGIQDECVDLLHKPVVPIKLKLFLKQYA